MDPHVSHKRDYLFYVSREELDNLENRVPRMEIIDGRQIGTGIKGAVRYDPRRKDPVNLDFYPHRVDGPKQGELKGLERPKESPRYQDLSSVVAVLNKEGRETVRREGQIEARVRGNHRVYVYLED